jgi:hypothetical protein
MVAVVVYQACAHILWVKREKILLFGVATKSFFPFLMFISLWNMDESTTWTWVRSEYFFPSNNHLKSLKVKFFMNKIIGKNVNSDKGYFGKLCVSSKCFKVLISSDINFSLLSFENNKGRKKRENRKFFLVL